MIKKDLIIAMLLTFCFTVTLFTVVPTIGSPDAGDYDPWLDINDDGEIDMRDVGAVARAFGSSGTAINKTELLLGLQEKIDILNATIMELENTVIYMNNTVTHLNETVVYLNSTGLGAPDYDSGFISISMGGSVTLEHSLGSTNLMVYLTAYTEENYYSYPYVEHIAFIGGDHHKDEYNTNYKLGAYWGISGPNHIVVKRLGGFGICDPWQYFRVRIWKIGN